MKLRLFTCILLFTFSSFAFADYQELSSTAKHEYLFHEQFHLLGYTHESGPDFAEACGSCCFTGDEPEVASVACRLCAGGNSP